MQCMFYSTHDMSHDATTIMPVRNEENWDAGAEMNVKTGMLCEAQLSSPGVSHHKQGPEHGALR